MGCADPPSKGVGAPHQCSRVSKKRSGWGEFVTYFLVASSPSSRGYGVRRHNMECTRTSASMAQAGGYRSERTRGGVEGEGDDGTTHGSRSKLNTSGVGVAMLIDALCNEYPFSIQ